MRKIGMRRQNETLDNLNKIMCYIYIHTYIYKYIIFSQHRERESERDRKNVVAQMVMRFVNLLKDGVVLQY